MGWSVGKLRVCPYHRAGRGNPGNSAAARPAANADHAAAAHDNGAGTAHADHAAANAADDHAAAACTAGNADHAAADYHDGAAAADRTAAAYGNHKLPNLIPCAPPAHRTPAPGGAPTNKEKTMKKQEKGGKWYAVRIKGMRITLWARSKDALTKHIREKYHNGHKANVTELV